MARLVSSPARRQALLPLLPVLVAVLAETVIRLHRETLQNHSYYFGVHDVWRLYWSPALQLLVESLPLLIAQFLMPSLSGWRRYLYWLLGFVAYPACSLAVQERLPGNGELMLGGPFWSLAAGLSLMYWLHQAYQRAPGTRGGPSWWRNLLSLDAALLLCLGGWVMLMSGIFVYNPDPMHNQPLEPRFDIGQMLRQWPLSLYYLWQFLLMALVVFTYYWVNRYLLVRKVLAGQGIYLFLLCSAGWLLLSYPLFGALVLQLPLNIAELSLLPSENHNPFDTLNLLVATIIWAVSLPLILAFERQQSARELAELTREQARAELKMLQQQVNPHFLFNTLNSLYALCLAQSAQAAPMVLKLSDLLRYVVYQGQKPRVSLEDDLVYLQNYLELQQVRTGRRCRIETDFQVPDGKWQIAPLLLIMLVENAFKHGVAASRDECYIRLSLRMQDTELVFECSNSLPGQTANQDLGGIGLANLKRRLQLSYPQRFTLLSEAQGQHWHARLRLQL
ncbi:histidine kinase [uncultured Microbulbifer sp.]|uniref:sensor histidine kinase n=1 Tax=uncultured Microbulbifer sp. TaxID=348147 RepID=UPI00260B7860|nr:histidine kinase [uncultured Microbulbifer sp.]